MAPNLGFATLILNLSINLLSCIFYWLYRKKTQPHQLYKIYLSLNIASFCCAILCQLFLIYCYLISDYSVINVYQNSHHLKPLLYKIAGSWGNHEGSMLLLITVLCGYNLFCIIFGQLNLAVKIGTCSIQAFIITLFCAYTAFTSNPFLTQLPPTPSGLGLNPILQDVGLALHPPMLYLGYLGFAIVFSLILSALIHHSFDKPAIKLARLYTYFATAILTLGIALGSWWAYRELGWGGYWFWDPVENISLMPWISSIAAIHALKIADKNRSMQSWSAFLIIITMILCLLGIFLTRSGVLTSVHSFAIAAQRGFFIIFLIAVIGSLGLLVFAKYLQFYPLNAPTKSKVKTIRKSTFLILVNNYFLIIALIVILIGTLYPILSRGLFNQFISIGYSYYNRVFNILLMPFLFLLLGNYLSFKNLFKISNVLRLILTLISLLVIFWLYPKQQQLLFFVNLFLAIYNLILNFSLRQKLSSALAHGGFLLLIIGVIISSSCQNISEKNITLNQSFQIANFDIKFTQIDYAAHKNFISRIGIFKISKNNQFVTTLYPELRFYPISNQITNESAIYHHPFYDLYLVIGTKDDKENYAIRAYHKPMMNLIWIGAIIIMFSLFINILQKILKK